MISDVGKENGISKCEQVPSALWFLVCTLNKCVVVTAQWFAGFPCEGEF